MTCNLKLMHTTSTHNSYMHKHDCTGDPFPDSVVIWTRLTPVAGAAPSAVYSVAYTVATDNAFTNVVSRGTILTSSEVDFTIKTIVAGLAPATKHYYKFTACEGAVQGPTGTTKTAPAADADVDTVAFATVSCSAYETGYFQAYGRIADKADKLDALLHLGQFHSIQLFNFVLLMSNVVAVCAHSLHQCTAPSNSCVHTWLICLARTIYCSRCWSVALILTLVQCHITYCCQITGDFIYEYGPYGGNVRTTSPLKEVVSLLDYRQRYAHYMGDSNLQRLRQVLPWILVPDDHEVRAHRNFTFCRQRLCALA
jgi:phosphodiesterase/alkaline phosphatase D-like protein